jgi:hypothetical protein
MVALLILALGVLLIVQRERFRELDTTLFGLLPSKLRPAGATAAGALMVMIAVALAVGVLDGRPS